ncbi:MAG: RDD family protein [Acidimicrobiia bacterium]
MQLDNRVTFATPEGVTLELVLAGLGSRFLARLLDTVIQAALIIALLVGVAVSGSPGWVQAIAIVATFLVVFAYDVILETLNNGRTIGKLAAGIRVVGRTGEPVRFLASAVRNIARILDFLPLLYLIGTIAIMTTERGQRVGDLAAGTLVTRDRFPGLTHTSAPITVTADAVATWDVSAVNANELQAVRHFLDRRLELRWPARSYFASDLANRLGPKVAGIPANSHPEYVLEGIVVAKQART